MKKFILLLLIFCVGIITAIEAQNQPAGEAIQITTFHRVDISPLKGMYAREVFVEQAAEAGFYTYTDVTDAIHELEFYSKTESGIDQNTIALLIEKSLQQDKTTTDEAKAAYLQQRTSLKAQHEKLIEEYQNGREGPSDEGSPGLCEDASVFCGSNIYQYPAGVNSGSGQVGPAYGCLGSTPNPVWYFMQIQNVGPITIHMYSTPSHDIDFICWGAFDSPTGACATGLTAANIIDCSFSGSATEDCDIPSPIAGKFYLLMITNYSNQACNITFSQSMGTGSTNCNIVINCSMLSITRNVSACNPTTNTFSVSGQMEYSNPPTTGTMIITDNTGVSQSFNPPFNSPTSYTLNNIPCDGASHTVTAHFSANATCTLAQTYNAPQASCPIASIKNDGEICDDGSTTPVTIAIQGGIGPYNFTYAINGTPTTVSGFNGTNYIINASIPGAYTLVSVENALCPGTVSGLATVTLHPLPVISLGADTSLCYGTNIVLNAGTGFKTYTWNTSQTTQTLNVTTAGTYSVSVTDFNSCIGTDEINIGFHPEVTPKEIKHN